MKTKKVDIWVYVQHRDGNLEEETFGLIAEARRLISESDGKGTITAMALGSGLETELELLGPYGIDRVLYEEDESLSRYQGELFAEVLFRMARKYEPSTILMAQSSETADLSSRLAAFMGTALVTRAVDFKINEEGKGVAVRPVANGYLFERVIIETEEAPIICFLPAVLSPPESDEPVSTKIVIEPLDISTYDLKTRVKEVIESSPEALNIEEADIVVSGGRGVGKGEAFKLMHELAGAIGGSVGGTRPIIDWQALPFDRQIGQTGKTVVPRLLFACGISGANEFTAGMEKSRLVIAVNTDPRARIFRFADLSVIGDVQEVIPRLIENLRKVEPLS